MKEKTGKKGSKQLSIASFCFSKPKTPGDAGRGPADGRANGGTSSVMPAQTTPAASETAVGDVPSIHEPSRKRQRLSPPAEPTPAVRSTTPAAAAPSQQSATPAVATPAPRATPDAAAAPLALPSSPPPSSAAELAAQLRARLSPGKAPVAPQQRRAMTSPASIPPRLAPRHERFQGKLVGEWERNAAAKQDRAPHLEGGAKYTPLELQVLDLKRENPGVLLAIEVGYKFLFFGEDAQVAAKECKLWCYPSHSFLVAGIPVPRLHVYVRKLVQAGHKVGIVRQVETAAIKAAGSNRSAPFKRQLSSVYTAATIEAGQLEDVGEPGARSAGGTGGGDVAWSNAQLTSYLMAVVEGEGVGGGGAGGGGSVDIGVVAVETSTGDVLYSQFKDGIMRDQLEACLLYCSPAELCVAEPLSGPTERLLANYAATQGGVRIERLQASRHPQGGPLAALQEFFGNKNAGGVKEAADADGALLLDGDAAHDDGGATDALASLPPLAVAALAAAVDVLRPLGLDRVLKQGGGSGGITFRRFSGTEEMSLSPNALSQLEILRNADDGAERGSLLWLLDRTKTAFGGRLLRRWVAHPLRCRSAIQERQDAVAELAQAIGSGSDGPLSVLPTVLAKLLDLERGITRILHRTASPPELLATLRALRGISEGFGSHLGSIQEGEQGRQDGDMDIDDDPSPSPSGVSSSLLRRLLRDAATRKVPVAVDSLLELLDQEAADANDKLRLFRSRERFPEVAACTEAVAAADQSIQDLLPRLAKQVGMFGLKYTSIQNQGTHLIELPVAAGRSVPKSWERVCSTKKAHRYHPPEVKAALAELQQAKERLTATCAAAWVGYLAEDASAHYSLLRGAVAAVAALDALLSLATLASSEGYCRPVFVDEAAGSKLHVVGGRHPVLDALHPGGVVANDLALGQDGLRVMVVTGPNMGGKSCLIRMAALMAVMAQVGSFVPAESAQLSVFDSVHTRMGASDNLAAGTSTFQQELSEASTILASAGPRSLVIMDELGRGTSTHDGLAIALATMQRLVETNRCITMFVTHYPQIARLSLQFPVTVGCFYMGYVVAAPQQQQQLSSAAAAATDATQAATDAAAVGSSASASSAAEQQRQGAEGQQGEEQKGGPSAAEAAASAVPRVTFLYKVTPGVADRSFGLNVARMASLPERVVGRAAQKAEELEREVEDRRMRRRRLQGSDEQPQQQDVARDGPQHEADERVRQLLLRVQSALQQTGDASVAVKSLCEVQRAWLSAA